MFELDNFIKEKKLNISLDIKDLETTPSLFIDYVGISYDNYQVYKLKTNPSDLDNYLANSMFDISIITELQTIWLKKSNASKTGFPHNTMINVINTLKKDTSYKFDKLLLKIEETIKANTINTDSFKMIFETYKTLSYEKPLSVQLGSTRRQEIYSTFTSKPNTSEYLEIVIMQIINGINVSGTFNEEQIKIIAENIEYYASYGDLLINNLEWGIPLLGQVLCYLTKHPVGTSKLSIKNILPLFENIKNQIQVNEQELLNRLDKWSKYAKEITFDEIETIIPISTFFKYSVTIKNDLTNHLNKIAIEKLTTIQKDALYQNRQKPNDYWVGALIYLIEVIDNQSIPDNIIEYGKMLLNDIAAGKQAIPTQDELSQKIIDKLNKKRTAALIKDIRNEFCNGNYIINQKLFIYLESWLRLQGDLLYRSADVVRTIIAPVLDASDCLDVIISNSDYYTQIINSAEDDATDLKDKIVDIMKINKESALVEFAKKIGVNIAESNE
jgi:hypothetical protein